MKTGVVESVQGNGGFDSKYGYLFSFEYKLDNGDFGVANHKTEQPKYKIGDTVNYEISQDDHGVKIKFVQADQGATSTSQPTTQAQNNQPQKPRSANASFAASYCKDLIVGGKVTLDDFEKEADRILTWLDSK